MTCVRVWGRMCMTCVSVYGEMDVHLSMCEDVGVLCVYVHV